MHSPPVICCLGKTCLLALSGMGSLVLLVFGTQIVGKVSAELQMRKACSL